MKIFREEVESAEDLWEPVEIRTGTSLEPRRNPPTLIYLQGEIRQTLTFPGGRTSNDGPSISSTLQGQFLFSPARAPHPRGCLSVLYHCALVPLRSYIIQGSLEEQSGKAANVLKGGLLDRLTGLGPAHPWLPPTGEAKNPGVVQSTRLAVSAVPVCRQRPGGSCTAAGLQSMLESPKYWF